MRRLTRRRFVALGSGLPLLGCDAVLDPSDPAPRPFMHGATLAAFQRGDFRAARAANLISSARASGFDWVAVAPGWYQSHAAATSMWPHPERTPDDQDVTNLILQARAAGLRVLLKPFVDSLDGVWRGEFEPPDVVEWLRAYREMHLHYATLAAAAGADLLSIGVELNFADGAYPDEWRRLVIETRAIYGGPLTYAANHSPGARGGGYADVRFWDALDFIGIDAYFALATGAQLGPPQLGLAWDRRLDQIGLWRLRSGLRQPVLFTEIGYESAAGAAHTPWGVDRSGPVSPDVDVQAELYRAAYDRPYRRAMLEGLFWWLWDPDGGGEDDSGFAPNGKPAAEVLGRAHGSTRRRPAHSGAVPTRSVSNPR